MFPDRIGWVVQKLREGYASIEYIHAKLLQDGLTEEQAYLTYKAARLLVQEVTHKI